MKRDTEQEPAASALGCRRLFLSARKKDRPTLQRTGQHTDLLGCWRGGVGNHSPGREEQAEEIRADMEEMQRLLARMKGEDGAESGA